MHQNKFHTERIQQLTIKYEQSTKGGPPLNEEEQKLADHLKILYKYANKGIKGRGKKETAQQPQQPQQQHQQTSSSTTTTRPPSPTPPHTATTPLPTPGGGPPGARDRGPGGGGDCRRLGRLVDRLHPPARAATRQRAQVLPGRATCWAPLPE